MPVQGSLEVSQQSNEIVNGCLAVVVQIAQRTRRCLSLNKVGEDEQEFRNSIKG